MLRYGDFDIGQVGSALSSAILGSYRTIEVRSSLTPPITLDVADLLDTSAPPSAFTKFLQPTLILTDANGQQSTIAPYGVAGNGSFAGIAFVAALIGAGFLCGRLSSKK